MDKLRSQMSLCTEILQRMSQADSVVEILEMIAAKLLDSFQVAHVAIYKLNKSANGDETGVSGSIVAEVIAPNGGFCSQVYIENLLSKEYEREVNLAKLFAEKAYLFGKNSGENGNER